MVRLVDSLITTCIILTVILCTGNVIRYISNMIDRFLQRYFGRDIAKFIINYMTFIGVVHHELSHALFAFLTGAKVIEIQLFHVTKDTLGQVGYITRGNFITKSIQSALASIAPIITGIVSEYLLYKLITIYSIEVPCSIIVYYIMFSILYHMRLSKQDTKMFLHELPVFSIIIFLIIYISNFNILMYI